MAHIYDYAIIGSGLTGLSIAATLSRHTDNIALIEAADVPFGSNKVVNFPNGPINNGLRFMPSTISSEKSIRFIESLIGKSIIKDSREDAPVTYEGGDFKTFLGFGDNPPAFYEELSYFTHSNQLELSIQPYEWTKLLFEQFKGDFLPRSYVTKFHAESDQVTHVTLNGSKSLYAKNFIFTGTVKDLALLLPEDALSIRNRTKLSKNAYWTGLCLDICHSGEVTERTSMHVLNGTTQDEIGPCVGIFHAPQSIEGEISQNSQWMTFIESELTDDSEVVGAALKKIKRQIKRAYPEALDNIKLERIFVTPIIGGNGELKLNANLSIPNLENLWVGSATMHEQKNLVGAILQAQLIISALGFQEVSPLMNNELEVQA